MGGMRMDAPKYKEDIRDMALSLIIHARLVVKLPPNSERGPRFNYDQGVLWRLESETSEEEFLMNPLPGVMKALIDSAQSDYWYLHEKDWGGSEPDCTAEDDYESESDAC